MHAMQVEAQQRTRAPNSAPKETGEESSSTKGRQQFLAAILGFRVRRLLACPRVQTIVRQVQDTETMIHDIGAEDDPLYKAMQVQLRGQKGQVHDIFFANGISNSFVQEIRTLRRASKDQ